MHIASLPQHVVVERTSLPMLAQATLTSKLTPKTCLRNSYGERVFHPFLEADFTVLNDGRLDGKKLTQNVGSRLADDEAQF